MINLEYALKLGYNAIVIDCIMFNSTPLLKQFF